MILDARPRGAGVAAAEWDSVHQVSSINVALDAAIKNSVVAKYSGETKKLQV